MLKDISEKVAHLRTLTDIDALTEGEKNSKRSIRSYFRINHVFYRRFHSEEGFMHFRVTKGESMTDADLYYQPDVVSRHIKPGARVLELGFGQGANLRYLAAKHPDASFTGVDLLPPEKKEFPENVTLIKGDYTSLPQLGSCSFDVIFGIETIVYCSDKVKLFKEMARLLKPSGVFIIYDYYLDRPFETFTEDERTAITLISKCGAGAMIEPREKWEGDMAKAGLRVESFEDLSKETLPDLERLARKAARVLEDHPRSARAMFRLAPRHFTNNVIIGYLGFDACRDGIMSYPEWVCRRGSR